MCRNISVCIQDGKHADYLNGKGCIIDYRYAGPTWLIRILGSYPAASLYLIESVELPAYSTDEFLNDSTINVISSTKDLQSLSFRYTHFSDCAVNRLLLSRSTWNIRSMTFENTSITGSAFANVNGLQSLRFLEMAFSKCDDSGVSNISRFQNLEGLDLTATDITESSIDSLNKLPKLNKLIAFETAISKDKFSRLKEKGVLCHTDISEDNSH